MVNSGNWNKILSRIPVMDNSQNTALIKRIIHTMKITSGFLSVFFIFVIVSIFVLPLSFGVSDFGGFSSSSSFLSTAQPQADFQTYYGGQINTYWPILSENGRDSQCEARQDLIIQVAPAGCQPAVVRSDLLAEQNVPVFCQLDALKLNPLIDISEIRDIQFRANYPKEVISTGFHPARAALRTRDRL